ncbi:hypothetical protein [Epilithonimonas sp.]|uniref:hypothetical protein n=1 Tax=Epilithonimonas sp. TaxID=2894511 RepID=UPI002FDE68D1
MRFYLSLLSSLLFSLSFAQKTVNARIITLDNDTLRTRVKVTTNMFDPTLIYGSSFTTKIKTITDDDKKVNIEASTVKELSFDDFNGKRRVFVNNSQDKKSLNEHIFNGKVLDWYRAYTASTGGETGSDFLINKVTNKGLGVGYFTGIPKKKLKEFLGDEPEMETFIEETKSSSLRNAENSIDNVMESIIKKYEALKAKK